MKYLKYILGIVILLILGFFVLGLIKSDISYESEILVEKSLAESWAVSQDEKKMADWLEGFQKVEQVSGVPGAVGSVSDVHFISEGSEMVIRETIMEIVPNESVKMSFTSDFMDMVYTLKMNSENGKTKIKTNTTVEGNGMVSKSFIALMGSSFKTQEDTNLNNLKKTIEKNTTNYFSEIN